jgi:tartrate dehydrogenase/decarboxylase / D-malate dehydrogenase
MMLAHLGEKAASADIVQAIERVLAEPALRTRDLGGKADTTMCGDAIVQAMS